MASQVWTQEMRKQMYTPLLKEFGLHRNWRGSRSPIDKKDQFTKTLAELAVQFTAMSSHPISPDAVKNQLDWGITVQKEIRDQSHARNYILNKAAALEVGFITSADLPEFMSVRQK